MQQNKSARTAAHLLLSTAALAHPLVHSASGVHATMGSVIIEGWVLKKRRKRMQGSPVHSIRLHSIRLPSGLTLFYSFETGFARRYFVLHQSGLLSYSFQPGQPARDQIQLNQAAISSAPGRKDVHIDSSNATFHIKCLSTDDFNKWMYAFR